MNDKKEILVGYFPIMEIKKAALQKQQSNVCGGVWVRASERLPKVKDVYIIREIGDTRFKNIEKFDGIKFTDFDEVMEWLDETQSTEQSNESEDVIEKHGFVSIEEYNQNKK